MEAGSVGETGFPCSNNTLFGQSELRHYYTGATISVSESKYLVLYNCTFYPTPNQVFTPEKNLKP